jgi:cell wall-associated NlpC family hydrolase
LVTEKLNAGWTDAIELNNIPMHLSLGSSLGFLHKGKAMINQFEISCERTLWDPKQHQPNGELILQIAMKYLNTPYLWGGRSVFGIDCSGFVQQVYRFFGIKLPRDAYQQAIEGELIGFLQESKCGDLAYFDNQEGKIIHVGILIDAETIIHASGKVRIDKIDNLGILNTDTGERSHQLRIIKRYFE